MDGAVGSVADTLSQSWDALRREIQVFRVKPGQREAELLWQMRALLVKVRAGQMLKLALIQTALQQLSVLNIMSLALDMSWY